MKPAILFLLAASTLHFEITDQRNKKPPGVSIETENPDPDGWFHLTVASKSKTPYTIVWPFDAKAKIPDGPGPIPVLVIPAGETHPQQARVIACILAARILTGQPFADLNPSALANSADPFETGVYLLFRNQPAEAIDPLARALRDRERQLTRVPSEIYPAAMLYGQALFAAAHFDDAAVAFLKAMNQRPSDPAPRKKRAEALIRAGKAEAAQELLRR
jgi:hypothetical protein